MYKLSEILKSIYNNNQYLNQALSNIYKNLDVRRLQQKPTGNSHIANPLNDGFGGFSSREQPLTGSESIEGEFLTLHLSTHDNMVLLLKHESLENLESEILNEGGLINPFTSNIHAIVKGQPKNYNLTFIQKGNRTIFNKDDQFSCKYGNNGATDLSPFQECKIEWI